MKRSTSVSVSDCDARATSWSRVSLCHVLLMIYILEGWLKLNVEPLNQLPALVMLVSTIEYRNSTGLRLLAARASDGKAQGLDCLEF
jgi:hypothetical protein